MPQKRYLISAAIIRQDNLILGLAFYPREEAICKLQALPWPVMRDPIIAYLRGEPHPGNVWLYRQQPDGTEMLAAHPLG